MSKQIKVKSVFNPRLQEIDINDPLLLGIEFPEGTTKVLIGLGVPEGLGRIIDSHADIICFIATHVDNANDSIIGECHGTWMTRSFPFDALMRAGFAEEDIAAYKGVKDRTAYFEVLGLLDGTIKATPEQAMARMEKLVI